MDRSEKEIKQAREEKRGKKKAMDSSVWISVWNGWKSMCPHREDLISIMRQSEYMDIIS